MPIPETQTNLKSFFETGDLPTQAQFAELIDTMFYLYNDAKDSADAATAVAAAAVASAEAVSAPVIVQFTNDEFTNAIVGLATGVASVVNIGAYNFRVTFTTPFLNTLYKVMVAQGMTILALNTNYIDVHAPGPGVLLALWK
jgi:hypothetical protein